MNNKNIIVQFIMVFLVIVFAFFLLLKFNVISFSSTSTIDGVLLSHHNVGLKIGASYQLSLNVFGNNFKNIVWTSSDESIATVSKNGKVTAHKEGKVTITSSILNDNYSDQCQVIVSNSDILINDIIIKNSKINMVIGGKYNLIYDILPHEANLYNILFTSSDDSVIEVSNSGVITAKRKGQAIIYVSANNGKIKDEVAVEVFNDNNDYKLPIKDEINVNVGGSYSFYNLSENNKLFWASLDENIATVNKDGVIYGKNIGNTKILVSSLNGNKKIINVNVTNEIIPVENISFDNILTSLEIGKEENINVLIEPTNATNQTLIWKSNNEKVITVNEYGKITAVSDGKSVLKVTSVDGKHYDEITINVEKTKDIIAPNDIIIPFEKIHLYVNDTVNIPISVSPSNSTFKNINISITDPKIISFNDGLLKANLKGESSLILTTNNNIKKEIKVIVDEVLATAIVLNKYDVSLKKNESMTIIPNIVPVNTTFKNIKWSSSDQDVVTVSSEGVIKAKSLGKALITATNINSNIETKMVVNVIE